MSEALDGRGELVTTQGGTQSISAIQRVSDLGQEAGRSPCRQISDGGVTVRKDDDEECRQGGGGPSRWRALCAHWKCIWAAARGERRSDMGRKASGGWAAAARNPRLEKAGAQGVLVW